MVVKLVVSIRSGEWMTNCPQGILVADKLGTVEQVVLENPI